MAKKNSTFGKFLAFTTAIAAIGGVCYIYRDKIKESETFKKASDKLNTLRNKVSNQFASDEDDFFFDDEFEDDFEDDIFSDSAKSNREYTSITINPKDETKDEVSMEESDTQVEESPIAESVVEDDSLSDIAQDVANDVANAVKEKTEVTKDEVREIFTDDSIPTISFGANQTTNTDKESTNEVLGYENEGLSDVDDDPDALSDQDKLDF